MSAANDPNANLPNPERDDAPEAGRLNPSQTTGEGGTPPRPDAAPKIRIQRGATVYAPWRRGGVPPAPPQQPSGEAPQTPAASPTPLVNYATPAVAPTVVIRPAPGSQNWTATEGGSEPTIEMTIEFAAIAEEELAQSAPPQFTVIRADDLPTMPPRSAEAAPVFAEASPILVEAPPAPIAAEPIPVVPIGVEARATPPVIDVLQAEATEFVAPEPEAPAVVVPTGAATPIAPSAGFAAEEMPAPAQAEIEEPEVETSVFVPAEIVVPSETAETAFMEPAAPLTPPLLAEATIPPASLTESELGPKLPAPPVAAEAETTATPPPAELFTEETLPEPVAAEPMIAAEPAVAEPVVEIPPFPKLDPIPLVPEIALLAETLPLTAALRQPIALLEPLPLPEPPVLVPETAEELPDAAVEAVPLIATPPASADAGANLAPVGPSLEERSEVAEEVEASAVPLLSPEIETFLQAFAPPDAEAVSEPPQEALIDETFDQKSAPVAETINAPAPVIAEEIAPVALEAEPIVAAGESQSGESVLPLEAVTAAPEFVLPVETEAGADASLTVATEEPEPALSPESVSAEPIIPPPALAGAEPLPLPEYAAIGTEPAPILPSPIEVESITAANAGGREERAADNGRPATREAIQAPPPPTPDPQPPTPAAAPLDAPVNAAPVLPTTRRTPGTPAPPVAQSPPETDAKPRGLLRPNRAARPAAPEPISEPDIEKTNRAAAPSPAPSLSLPSPIIPGDRPTQQETAQTERLARDETERQGTAQWERSRRMPPLSSALPGAARFFAGVGLICAALGLLARPLAEATKGSAPLAAIAHFANALEGDSRMQWRNLQRRPEGAAISASRRTEARVVVILAEQRRGAARDENSMGRVELARLMHLCHEAGVPVIGVTADTAALPRTTAIAVGGPQPTVKQGPDPLAAAIRDIQQAGTGAPRPTLTVLPAVFAAPVQGETTAGGARLRANTDPLLSSKGIVRGFIGPSPVAADFGEGTQKGTPPRRSLTLSARVAPPPGGTASAVSLPAALAFLTLPDAALWPQVGGTETADSGISRRLSTIFAYPGTPSSNIKPGENPVAIDFGLLQSDPEGVQVVSADYVRSLSVSERRTLLESRPVVIGLDRPADWIQTPLSSPRFVVLPPVKPTMAAAEAEGRAAAMLLARAERNSQPGNLKASSVPQPGDAAPLPPPAPYLEPVPTDSWGWAALPPAALLGYLLASAGRRLAAPAVKAPREPHQELEPTRASTRRRGDLGRSARGYIPAFLGLALAGAIGWAWRVYGTPGFASYIAFPGFAPWAAPWASSLFTAGIFFLALIGMWMAGPAWRGKGVALIVAVSALAFCALAVQDFVLFPAWTPLLAPLGGFLLGSAARLGIRDVVRRA